MFEEILSGKIFQVRHSNLTLNVYSTPYNRNNASSATHFLELNVFDVFVVIEHHNEDWLKVLTRGGVGFIWKNAVWIVT